MPLGLHLLAEFHGCDSACLASLEHVTQAMLDAARGSGATVVTHSFHHFDAQDGGQGVSGVVIIAESHLAIHTWPEHRFAAVDFFTCGEVHMERGLSRLKKSLGAQSEDRLQVERGPLQVLK
jgi:S-adenosylmethionine decarboxylase proenzyme